MDYEKIDTNQVVSESNPFTEERYRQFFSFMEANRANVLDIGCNTGRGGRVLKDLNNMFTISGLDVVQDRLDRLPGDVYGSNIYGSSTNIPVDDGNYDYVTAGEFVEHLYAKDVDLIFAEMFRVLKTGGMALLTTPNPNDFKRKLRGGSVLGGAYVSQYFPDILKLRLKMSGFNDVNVYGSGKVKRYLGNIPPLLGIYGSYLVVGIKR